ncbi:hypothetical protein [Brevundimonas abyssalis]|nr:hypothetical protein [Brevundimonas abyssalis]
MGLYLAATPDFFFEGVVRSTEDGSFHAIAPVRVTLDAPLRSNPLRSNRRSVLVSFAVGQAGSALDIQKTGATVVLGEIAPGELVEFDQDGCVAELWWRIDGEQRTQIADDCTRSALSESRPRPETLYATHRSHFESEWFSAPLSAEMRPMTLMALVSETRRPSAFLTYVADVFGAVESGLTTELQRALIPRVGLAASEAEANAYDTAYGAAGAALRECVATPEDPAKRAAARNRLRDFLRTARQGGQAATDMSAHVNSITLNGTTAAPCEDALTALREIS